MNVKTLKPVLQHWEREEKKRAALVMECDVRIAEKKVEIRVLQDRLVSLDREFADLARACTHEPAELSVYLELQRRIRFRLGQLRGFLANLEAERARREAHRVDAARQKRRLEIACERALTEARAAADAAQAAFLDELAVLRFSRGA